MANRYVLLISLLLACQASKAARAEVRVAKIFGDYMVLQRDKPIPVWGWANPGEEVTVEFAGQSKQAAADDNGKWMATLAPVSAGGPYTLAIQGDAPPSDAPAAETEEGGRRGSRRRQQEADAPLPGQVLIRDVLVGEVWICSGQSNMEWPVKNAMNAEDEIFAADLPRIRHFKVGHKIAETPQDDCTGTWQICSPRTVSDFTAVGYFFARQLLGELNVPVGLIGCNWGGTLAEAWTSRQKLEGIEEFAPILERAEVFSPKNPNQASVLYNGMLHPLIPLGIRGVIWYQGESNVSRAQQYAKLFPAMINDWRGDWYEGDLPFLFVQLAPYRYGGGDPQACAELWEAQLKTLSLPNTGMAVTVDIGNVKDIHPRNKQEVGRRLALWALAKMYGKQDLVYSGPLYESMSVEGNSIRIHFKHVGGGLTTRDGQPPSHFTIAGKDEQFHEASATIDGDTLLAHSDQVEEPVAVRYAWRDDAEPNLGNVEGLPASPFRTDDFKMVTEGKW